MMSILTKTLSVMAIPINSAAVEKSGAVSLLALLHISSPALPIGAFAYSQGLEYALDRGWCTNRETVQQWLEDNLRFGIGGLDLPVYARLYRAWQAGDNEAVAHWNQSLIAFRETRELYLEDVQVGSAFAQWHLGQDKSRQQYLDACEQPTVVAMHALASHINGIELEQGLLGFCWGWAENQIACASKAMPMGQTDGQRVLQYLLPKIAEVCEQALILSDDEIGTSLFSTAMASALHEHQYSRLFRS